MNKYKETIEEAFESLEHCEFILRDSSEWRDMLRGVVQKAIAKNPYSMYYGDHFDCHCPVCDKLVFTVTAQSELGDNVPKYCYFCGQKLDWGKK